MPIVLLILWCALAAAATPPPLDYCKTSAALLPRIEDEGPVPGFDVESYELDLRLDPDARRVDGTVTTTVRFDTDDANRIVALDLVDNLTVASVTWDGVPIDFTHADDRLVLSRTGLDPGVRTATIAVDYGGRPQRHGELYMGLVFRDRGPSPSEPLGPIIFNVSEPVSSHAWWPCRDVPWDKALVTVALTVPDTLDAVANGLKIDDAPAGPGWRRTVWASAHPMPPYLVGISVSEFVHWEEDCAGDAGPLRLTYDVFPEDEQLARTFFEPTCAAMDFLEGVAGPYPFPDERYGQMEIKWGGAMEHQTSSSIGNAMIHTEALFLDVVLHELAHQWFGDLLTPATWHDIWLNEGFARFCEALWVEHRFGRAAYLEFLRQIGPARHPLLFTDEGPLGDPSPILQALVYDKGAWVLHMLRERLGDDRFFDLLRSYADDPDLRFASVSSSDFIAHASAVAGESLDGWFEPWLHTTEVPTLAWSWSADPAASRGDIGTVTVDVAQQQPTLFDLHLPVFVVARGDTSRHVLTGDRARLRGDFRVRGPVDQVLLDPEATVLMTTVPLAAPAIDLTAVRPNPVPPSGAVVDFTLLHTGPVTFTLYDARGRLLERWEPGEFAGGDDHTWTWPGPGERTASAVYWLEAVSGGMRSVKKIVTVR